MMSRRKAVILGILIVAVVLGLEWTFRYGSAVTGCAQVVNEGVEPMEGLVARYAGTSVNLGRLAPGETTKVWFSGAGRGALTLEFTQKGNPMKGFKVDDFDPTEHRRDGSRLVLVVKSSQIDRYVEEDDGIRSAPRMLDRLMDWIRDELR